MLDNIINMSINIILFLPIVAMMDIVIFSPIFDIDIKNNLSGAYF
jgi:hypothetical protein